MNYYYFVINVQEVMLGVKWDTSSGHQGKSCVCDPTLNSLDLTWTALPRRCIRPSSVSAG